MSPGLVPRIVREGRELGVPTVPGVLSPTEMLASGRGGREHREAVPREPGRGSVSRCLAGTVPRRPLHPDGRDRHRGRASLVGGRCRVRRPRERARRRRRAADAVRSRTDHGKGPAGRRPLGWRRVTSVPDVIALGETMRSVITVARADRGTRGPVRHPRRGREQRVRRARTARVARRVGEPARHGCRRRPRDGGAARARRRPPLGPPRPRAPDRIDVPRDDGRPTGLREGGVGGERARAGGPRRGAGGAGLGRARHRHHGHAGRGPAAGGDHAARRRARTACRRPEPPPGPVGIRPRAGAHPTARGAGRPPDRRRGRARRAGRRTRRPCARRTMPSVGSA